MNILVYVVVLIAFVIAALAATRARSIALRDLPAYVAMPMVVGEAVETGRSVHMSFGSSAIRDTSTLSAIASAEVLYYLAERSALSDRPTLVTVSDPVTLGLGQDTMRRAYKARGVLNKYSPTKSRWYPEGRMSLAFAAGAGAAMLDENAASNITLGRFGPELMLIAENAVRYDRRVLAQSDQIDGQAVAFAVSEVPLIGEELYTGAAYLSQTPFNIGTVVAQDVLRYLVVAFIIGLFFLAIFGMGF